MTIIETPRLLLRLSTPETYKEVMEHYSPDAIKQFLGLATDNALEEARDKYKRHLTNYRSSFAYFHMIEKGTGRIMGDCSYHTWYFLHDRAEIGYSLRDDHDKNKGYMTEAIREVLRYGFGPMNLNRVEAFISPDNIPSQKLVRAMGFTEEGRLREHYRKQDRIEDSLVFGLLRKEFKP